MATAAKVIYAHIVKEAGYCGGKATIDGTRIRVNNVVFLLHRLALDCVVRPGLPSSI